MSLPMMIILWLVCCTIGGIVGGLIVHYFMRYRIGYRRRRRRQKHSRESMGAAPLKRRPRYESLEEELAAIDAMKPPPGKVWSSGLILDGNACYDPRPMLRGVVRMTWRRKEPTTKGA